MALVAGKVMMDRNAPEQLTQPPVPCARDCEELINRWHGKGRVVCADATVRHHFQ